MEKQIHELESCVHQIDTRTYDDFTIDKSYFKRESIFTTGNEMRKKCYDLF